jgi:methyl-accepting chemotaxis protein
MAVPCWEYENCNKKDECPAFPNRGFDCWGVAGTLCRGERQGSYDEKVNDCRSKCSYYLGVMSGSIPIT